MENDKYTNQEYKFIKVENTLLKNANADYNEKIIFLENECKRLENITLKYEDTIEQLKKKLENRKKPALQNVKQMAENLLCGGNQDQRKMCVGPWEYCLNSCGNHYIQTHFSMDWPTRVDNVVRACIEIVQGGELNKHQLETFCVNLDYIRDNSGKMIEYAKRNRDHETIYKFKKGVNLIPKVIQEIEEYLNDIQD